MCYLASFRKTGKIKLGAKPVHATHVSGLSNDSDIGLAEMFACKFAANSNSKNRNSDQRCDASLCTDGYSVTSNNDEISLFDVADVDNAVFNMLKRGKAAGIDGVSPEHILYAIKKYKNKNWLQFLFIVKAAVLKQQISQLYPQIQRTEASDHIYFSQRPFINVKAIFCA